MYVLCMYVSISGTGLRVNIVTYSGFRNKSPVLSECLWTGIKPGFALSLCEVMHIPEMKVSYPRFTSNRLPGNAAVYNFNTCM